MNWWLLLLWPLSGLLGWAWKNHLVYRETGLVLSFVGRILMVFAGMVSGPVAVLVSAIDASISPREHRWGLRFW